MAVPSIATFYKSSSQCQLFNNSINQNANMSYEMNAVTMITILGTRYPLGSSNRDFIHSSTTSTSSSSTTSSSSSTSTSTSSTTTTSSSTSSSSTSSSTSSSSTSASTTTSTEAPRG
ncbi:hypothetical protein I4U23_027196 [Adineta vaga]|nr:hypothetical protein I4U23_027196 [Adineta vaga]